MYSMGPKGSFMDHVYDFYKPTLRESAYPIVDGHFSLSCYMRALQQSYLSFVGKYEKRVGVPFSLLEEMKYIVFHSPFCKMVDKAFARLVREPQTSKHQFSQNLSDALRCPLPTQSEFATQ